MPVLSSVLLWMLTFIILFLTVTYWLFFAISFKKRDLPVEKTLEKEEWKPYAEEIRSAVSRYEELENKQLYILTRDNIRLTGFYTETKKEKRGCVIMVNDYRTPSLVNFAPILLAYLDSGYDVLLTESRAHHESLGKFVCFGARERYDLKLWIECVNKLYGDGLPVYLHGVGMGGTTVLMTAGLELPRNVAAVLAESAYTSPYAIVRKQMKKRFLIAPEVLLRYFDFWCRSQAGYHLKIASTQEALRKTKLPVFLLHGENDPLAPIAMAEANADACASEKRFVRIAGGGHGTCLYEAREQGQAALSFFGDYAALPEKTEAVPASDAESEKEE